MSATDTPTLYEWAGGREAIDRLTQAFYEHVRRDELGVANSQPGADPPPKAPVSRWGWGEGPPYLPS